MNPNEIFGYPTDNFNEKSNFAFKNYFCRFLNAICDKQSRIIPYPMGICSVNHGDKKAIICPHRFLESNIIFTDICNENFGTTDNILLFKEIRIENVGSFDFVLVKHKPMSNKIDDFCIIEFQSDATTGTGKLVDALKDFMNKSEISDKKYLFGLNTYGTIKLSYMQMLVKGQVLERWNKNIFWILQKYVYENMVNRFKLVNMDYIPENKTKYFIYEPMRRENIYQLEFVDKKSSSISNLLKAFTDQPTPSLDNFIEVLQNKIKLNIGLNLT